MNFEMNVSRLVGFKKKKTHPNTGPQILSYWNNFIVKTSKPYNLAKGKKSGASY